MSTFQTFLQVLPLAGAGWLGVFVVTIVIILGADLLNYFTSKKYAFPFAFLREEGRKH